MSNPTRGTILRRHGIFPVTVALAMLFSVAHGAQFEARWRADLLTLASETSSAGHAETLRRVVPELFPDARHEIRLAPGTELPAGWSLFTEQALRTLARASSAEAAVEGETLVLRGYYADASLWHRERQRLEAALPDGMQLRDEAVAGKEPESFAKLCQQQFAAALRNQQVRFRFNSSELSPASYALLDALVEIAMDCAASQIRVTGHSDASGDAALNQVLSERRALAVLNYLTSHGIKPARLRAEGAGSSERLDASGTRAARARNRRIEFEFDFANSERGAGQTNR